MLPRILAPKQLLTVLAVLGVLVGSLAVALALFIPGASAADSDSQQYVMTERPEPPAQEFSTEELEVLFDEIISKTERREAFSDIKESNIGFSALEDMKKLRSEFVASRTETELYYALVKLSNARRDRHLGVSTVPGGLQPPEQRPCVSAAIHVLPDYSDIDNPTFFVAAVDEGLSSPEPGDVIVGVNGQSRRT